MKLPMVLGGYTLVAYETFFLGGTSEIIFQILRKPNLCNRLQAGKKEEVGSTYITPVLPITQYICPRCFEACFEIFASSEVSATSRRNTNDICGELDGRLH